MGIREPGGEMSNQPLEKSYDNPLSTEAHGDVHRERSANAQAAFLLPNLREGMSVITAGAALGR
jgi:hypothetical protein